MILSLVLFVLVFLVVGIFLDRKYSKEQPDESKVRTPVTLTYSAVDRSSTLFIVTEFRSVKEFGTYMRANKKKCKQ